MTIFHRLADPTYYVPGGGFPTDYDKINDPTHVSVGETGSAAAVTGDGNGRKDGGTNDGIYFVGFKDQGTSGDVNRGLSALSLNTDYLDDIVNSDISKPENLEGKTSTGDSSYTFSGGAPVFVGVLGTSSTPKIIREMFRVLDSSGNELVVDAAADGILVPVVITLVHNGASVDQIGVPTSGYYADPTVDLSPTIPSGVAYTIAYSVRSSLKASDASLLTGARVQPSMFTDRDTLVDVSRLYRRGLDGAYRRSTSSHPNVDVDTGASGAIIDVDGGPVQFRTFGAQEFGAAAALVRGYEDNVGVTTPSVSDVGSTGYVVRSDYKGTVSGGEEANGRLSGASFMDAWPHDTTAAVTVGGANVRTQVTTGSLATLNVGGAAASTITLNASDFFWIGGLGVEKSSVLTGYDMLDVTRASGDVETYYIVELDTGNARLAYLAKLTGDKASFPADEVVTARWVSLMYRQGVGALSHTDAINGDPHEKPKKTSFFVRTGAPQFSDGGLLAENDKQNSAVFCAPTIDASEVVIAWGGFGSDASTGKTSVVTNGILASNGDIVANGSVYSSGGFKGTHQPTVSVDIKDMSLGNDSIDPDFSTDQVASVSVTGADAGNTLTVNNTVTVPDGQSITMVFARSGGAGSILAWDSDFKFSSPGDKQISQVDGSYTKYVGIKTLPGIFMTKTVY